MAELYQDPFTQVYNALWKLVERNKNLQKLIPIGNRIKYEHESQEKEILNSADTPELALLCAGGSFGKNDSSSARGCTRVYAWYITTGNLALNPLFNGISWELYRSMVDYACVLCDLTWCNCRFVTEVRIISAEDGTTLSDQNREIPGWSSMWQVEVDFVFPFQALKIKE